jgi:carotenoid cleavage dioxygenase-like enzyme
MNAHSDGSQVIAEVARYPRLPFFGVERAEPATLHRWTIDLVSGTVKEEPLDDCPAEFPRMDERFAGKPYRHGYSAGGSNPLGGLETFDSSPGFDSVIHYDLAKDSKRVRTLGAGDVAGEPVFVPRSADAEEGDGFLLVLAYRGAEGRSDLLVLDAQNVDGEALATVKLPHRVPYGFHGNWRQAG